MSLPLLALFPLLLAWLPRLMARFGRRQVALAAALPTSIALILLADSAPAVFAGEVVSVSWPWLPAIGLDFALHLDGLSWMFALLVLGIGLLVILYAHYYLAADDDGGRFFTLLLLFMGSMLGLVLSGNLLLMVLFWELTSITSFLLIGYWSGSSAARRGARMAMVITGAGGLALLAGVLLLGQVVGSYALVEVLAAGDQIRAHSLYPLILTLVLVGAFTKSAQFPFHFWLPHAMAAPTPVSAYLHSATMVKAGVFLLARLYPALSGTDLWFWMVSSVGLVTLVMGAWVALFSHDLKGLLAYSTISHLGLITMLFGLDTSLATVAAVFHIINHATFKASLFMAAGIIDHETGTREFSRLGGLRRYMPFTAVLAAVAAMSMAGVPLLNGFLSKEKFFAEAITTQLYGGWHWLVPVLSVLAGMFAVAYSLRFVRDVFFGETPDWIKDKPPHDAPRYMLAPVEILVGLCLLVGILPVLTVNALLAVAAAATIGGEPAPYSLAIWHGFNLPLLMSAIALLGGLVLYFRREQLFRWQRHLPRVDAGMAFEFMVQGLSRRARRLEKWLVNGSLQRYMALLLLSALAVMIGALWGWRHWAGGESMMPVDGATLIGAVIMCSAALAAVFNHRRRLVSLVQLSAVGLMVALAFARFSAPDLALTQLSVEIVTIVFLMLALYFLPQDTPAESGPWRISRDALIAVTVGVGMAALTWALLTRPFTTISDYFIHNSVPGGGGTNVVNVILVDFRGFDTLGEISVLAIAAIGVYALLKDFTLDAPGTPLGSHVKPHPLIMGIVARPLLPIALLLAVYILFRGHNLPGGGFIAGLVTAVALILQFVARGVDWTQARLGLRYHPMLAVGLGFAVLTGMASGLFGFPFLTSTHSHLHIPLLGEIELASAMLFDLGVYFTVVAATLLIIGRLGSISAYRGEDGSH